MLGVRVGFSGHDLGWSLSFPPPLVLRMSSQLNVVLTCILFSW